MGFRVAAYLARAQTRSGRHNTGISATSEVMGSRIDDRREMT
jgi:hypothetical protein